MSSEPCADLQLLRSKKAPKEHECSLCFKSFESSLTFCQDCNCYFCTDDHLNNHRQKTQHRTVIERTREQVRCNQCNVQIVVPCLKKGKTCPHPAEFTETAAYQLASSAKCKVCEDKENLWICLLCGNIGCGRRQYDGSGGKDHALEHFSQTAHPVVHKIGTITNNKGDFHCYVCEETVEEEIALSRFGINTEELQKKEKKMAELENELNNSATFNLYIKEEIKELKENKEMVKIGNIGNTCYISVAVYALATVIDNIPSVTEHYSICSTSPSECVLCQLLKVIDKIKTNKEGVVYPHMLKDASSLYNPRFSDTTQQDASEFLMFLLDVLEINTGEDCFDARMETQRKCSECGKKNKTKLSEKILVLTPDERNETSIDILLDNFFCWKELPIGCDCGNKTTQQRTALLSLPKTLAVQVQRFTSTQKTVSLRKDLDISVPFQTVLNRFLDEDSSSVDKELVSVLVDMGIDPQTAMKALQIADGDLTEAVSYVFEERKEPRNQQASYSLVSFIIHKGEDPSFGHYVSVIKKQGKWFLLNDEFSFELKQKDVEKLLKDACLCFYKQQN